MLLTRQKIVFNITAHSDSFGFDDVFFVINIMKRQASENRAASFSGSVSCEQRVRGRIGRLTYMAAARAQVSVTARLTDHRLLFRLWTDSLVRMYF